MDYAAMANREHALAHQSGEDMLAHAALAGEALIAAKAILPHGQWLPWLAANFDGHQTTAAAYMRFVRDETKRPRLFWVEPKLLPEPAPQSGLPAPEPEPPAIQTGEPLPPITLLPDPEPALPEGYQALYDALDTVARAQVKRLQGQMSPAQRERLRLIAVKARKSLSILEREIIDLVAVCNT